MFNNQLMPFFQQRGTAGVSGFSPADANRFRIGYRLLCFRTAQRRYGRQRFARGGIGNRQRGTLMRILPASGKQRLLAQQIAVFKL